MNEKTIEDNPTISDKIAFDIDTPDSLGNCSGNPYEVSKIVIYFVSRDYASGNLRKYEEQVTNQEQSGLNDFYFKEAEPVYVVGSEDYPAWLSTDVGNAFIENVETCLFRYVWEPKGAREGDYFICWTWKPMPAGGSLSNHRKFYLKGDTQQTTSIPSHQTKPKKYETLLERYLPGTFKDRLSITDVSPDVLDRMNKSIAGGFTVLEDLANQIVDLHDANCVGEFILPYLSNYFGLKLKGDDPARWRGQIKRAVPLYKRKGTKGGLREALEHIGVNLNKVSQLWQVISSKTWQESFFYDGISSSFRLEKSLITPIDENNFELWIRRREGVAWTAANKDSLELSVDEEGATIVTWVEDSLVLNSGDEVRILYEYSDISSPAEQDIEDYIRGLPLIDNREQCVSLNVQLRKGSDLIKKLPVNSDFIVGQKVYSNELVGGEAEIIEVVDYSTIRVSSNALSNNSNASIVVKKFEYPPKNWNVRAIQEDDPMFDVIIPERNPFFDSLVFGKVRTEFPYSENIYHMEEYNGSIRDSKDPCDIDKSFVDPCYSCISSSYDIDVEVENLSDDKIKEVKSVIEENTPFHAVMHTCNFVGSLNEFTTSPQENLEMLTTYVNSDFVVAGYAQRYFSRTMLNFRTQGIKRGDLAEGDLVYSGSGVCSNQEIVAFCPGLFLSSLGTSSEGSYIDIKEPSSIAGEYDVAPSEDGSVRITDPSLIEPIDPINSPFSGGVLDTSAFTFDLNNPVFPINGTLCNIEQNNVYKLGDEEFDFNSIEIKTLKDAENDSSINAWEVELSYGNFQIRDILGNSLIIDHHSELPVVNTLEENWVLKNNGVEIANSSKGKIFVEKRGIVTSLDSSCHPVAELIVNGEYYQKVRSTEYSITGIVEGTNNKYYLYGYDQEDMNGVIVKMINKIVKNKIGYLTYRGLKLESQATESALGIQNGASYSGGDLLENNSFKENFILVINDVEYWIHEINDNIIMLSGAPQYFKTSGTAVEFEVYKYSKEENIEVQGQRKHLPDHVFPKLDRSGSAVIFSDTLEDGTNTVLGLSGGGDDGGEVKDFIGQREEVSLKIEYKKGDEND